MYKDSERRDKIGEILEETRKNRGIVQTDLCAGLGIVRSTWRSWINGFTMPSVDMMYKIFRFMNSPIMMALAQYAYPDDATVFDTDNPNELKKQIKFMVKNSFTDYEILAVNDFLSGDEQEVNLTIELSAAHVMSSLSGRYKAATLVYEDYVIVDRFGKHARPDLPKPDMESLRQAITLGKQAHFENAYAYSVENHTTNDIGKMITELRESNGKSQEDLAKMMSVDKATIKNWENNVTPLDIDELLKMLELFKVPIGRFMTYYTYPYSKFKDRDIVANAEKELYKRINKINNTLILLHLKFLSLGMYGSRYNLVQLISAYRQLPLSYRQRIANIVSMNYRESEQNDSINRFKGIPLPDIEYIEKCRDAGRNAYLNGEMTYSLE